MSARWYVVQTHALAEVKAVSHLQRQGFETYLPQTTRWISHARQRKLVKRPLFSRYVFVRLDPDTMRWRSILSTVGVSNLICQGDRPAPVSEKIVDAIRAAEEQGIFDVVNELATLGTGDQVRVVRGPFSEFVGKLQSLMARDRVCVLLEILGREVPTTFNVSEIAPA